MSVTVVRHSERPALWDRVPEVFAGVVPEYNLHGDVNSAYWTRLFEEFPDHQFALYDEEADDILGAGRSVPRPWDGTPGGLGAGLDDSMARAFRAHDAGTPPDALCALGIEIPRAHQGRGLSRVLLRQMTALARAGGLSHVIVPVRPTRKDRYPLVPIERYATWTRADGSPFDPWVRVQVGCGGVVAAAVARSSRITGTVADWEAWTGMAFPDDGAYVFPGGLATVHIDHGRDRGSYWEPAVWVTHDVRDGGRGPDRAPEARG
ncbi:hypothetical protein GCM10010145_43940 [Streptomyces ruber]|uniref:Uncharacterized protein n=2 Tax=Streptomyces TaxID=1883 RepID=A0A918BIP3_9ACTN|nr:N-acetyltransferase [Streptomyces ruber]GGQ69378.1 hypothetical protein GCM10010145_43940 [Streptomyces ruber]